jgi:hypothetical protein
VAELKCFRVEMFLLPRVIKSALAIGVVTPRLLSDVTASVGRLPQDINSIHDGILPTFIACYQK